TRVFWRVGKRSLFREEPNNFQIGIYFLFNLAVKLKKITVIVNNGCVTLIGLEDFGIYCFRCTEFREYTSIEFQYAPVIIAQAGFLLHTHEKKIPKHFIVAAIHNK